MLDTDHAGFQLPGWKSLMDWVSAATYRADLGVRLEAAARRLHLDAPASAMLRTAA